MKKSGRPPIIDSYTKMDISYSKKCYLRKFDKGICFKCDNKIEIGRLCLKHHIEQREKTRIKQGNKKRLLRSLSYKMERNFAPIEYPNRKLYQILAFNSLIISLYNRIKNKFGAETDSFLDKYGDELI